MKDNVERRVEPAGKEGMSLIVKTITKWIKGFIFLFGVYIIIYGHLTPGGGFAGGVIVSCAFILVALAFGKNLALERLSKDAAYELDSVGALIFLVVAILGIAFGGTFFVNFLQRLYPGRDFQLFSAGIIPICNIAIGIKVGASLFLVFVILSALKVVIKGEERKLYRGKRAERSL